MQRSVLGAITSVTALLAACATAEQHPGTQTGSQGGAASAASASSATAAGTGGSGGAAASTTASTASSSGAGGCAQGCGAGSCVNGECHPYTLGNYVARDPALLAVSPTALFGAVISENGTPMIPNGEILRIPLAMGAATTVAKGIQPRGLAADDKAVYWTDNTPTPMGYRGILFSPEAAQDDMGTSLAAWPDPTAEPGPLVQRGGEMDIVTLPPQATITPISTMGIWGETLYVSGNPTLLTTDGNNLYYYDGKWITRYLIATGTLKEVALMSGVRGLGADPAPNGFLYWTMITDAMAGVGAVLRASKLTFVPEVVASNRPWPGQIIADGASVYWVEGTSSDCKGGSIERWKTSDPLNTPTEIAATPTCAALADDATHLYWTSGGTAFAKVKP